MAAEDVIGSDLKYVAIKFHVSRDIIRGGILSVGTRSVKSVNVSSRREKHPDMKLHLCTYNYIKISSIPNAMIYSKLTNNQIVVAAPARHFK